MAIVETSRKLTVPFPLTSGFLETMQLAEAVEELIVQSTPRARDVTGSLSTNLMLAVEPKLTVKLKVLEKMTAPLVALTAVTDSDPASVFAVALIASEPEAVTLMPLKVVFSSVTGVAPLTLIVDDAEGLP